jgi:putative drug exporter of the RND superfamily
MAGLARWCFRHRYIVLVLWVAALAGLGVANSAVGSAYSSNLTLPGSDSTRALNLLTSAFPQQSGDSDTIVWHVTSGSVKDQAVQQRISGILAQVAKAPEVGQVTSPYATDGAAQISQDGRTAYATVTFDKQAANLDVKNIQNVVDLAQTARTTGLQVELGGDAVQQLNQPSTLTSELIGIIAAAVVLLLAFGALLAMLLPLVTAVLSLFTALMTIGLLSNAFTIPDFAPTLGVLIGLGVGIDYALFIVTRHRNGIKTGLAPEESAVRALNTSGRAVIFAGATVCVAMLGLLVLNLNFLTGVGVAAAIVVLFSVLAAATLLPALLGIIGIRVLSRRERRPGTGEPTLTGNGQPGRFWTRWAGLVQARPALLAPIALLVMAILAIPAFSLRVGSSDQGNDPATTTTRKAYDLLANGFGPGFNGPLVLVAELHTSADGPALTALTDTLQHTPGVAAAVAVPHQAGAKVAIVQVIPTTAPEDARTSDLITQLRTQVIPAAERGTSLQVHVGGQTAVFDDFASVISGKLPLFIGVIIALGFILLMVAFRSIVVPLTAAVMNLLAAGASFGVVVAFFQWGWGSEALGLGKAGPIESFLPVMMLAILFGLSMDYQVFLVSRMHEEWVHTKDNPRAVALGQATTGPVITAAATIMICVFMAFVFGGERTIAEFGVGLASAVLLDAFILRTVLVPALMHLLGRANWWLPGWIDRRLPQLSVEPADEQTPDPAPREPLHIGTP